MQPASNSSRAAPTITARRGSAAERFHLTLPHGAGPGPHLQPLEIDRSSRPGTRRFSLVPFASISPSQLPVADLPKNLLPAPPSPPRPLRCCSLPSPSLQPCPCSPTDTSAEFSRSHQPRLPAPRPSGLTSLSYRQNLLTDASALSGLKSAPGEATADRDWLGLVQTRREERRPLQACHGKGLWGSQAWHEGIDNWGKGEGLESMARGTAGNRRVPEWRENETTEEDAGGACGEMRRSTTRRERQEEGKEAREGVRHRGLGLACRPQEEERLLAWVWLDPRALALTEGLIPGFLCLASASVLKQLVLHDNHLTKVRRKIWDEPRGRRVWGGGSGFSAWPIPPPRGQQDCRASLASGAGSSVGHVLQPLPPRAIIQPGPSPKPLNLLCPAIRFLPSLCILCLPTSLAGSCGASSRLRSLQRPLSRTCLRPATR